MFTINNKKIDEIKNLVKNMDFKLNLLPGIEKAKNYSDAKQKLTLYFFVDAICHQTQNFFKEINGKNLKGWDFLLNSFVKEYGDDKDFTLIKRMEKIKGEDLKKIFSGSGDRYYERAYLLRNCAYILKRDFNGDIFEINKISDGFIKREDRPDMIKLFHKFKAYKDPLNKKTFLFLNIAKKVGYWEIKDPENLWTPVDYHLERVSLRIGIVDLDKKILKKLIENRRVPQSVDLKLREKIGNGVKKISDDSNIEIEKIDQIFWALGRSICFKDGPKCDGVDSEKTTFEEITKIGLREGCPFRNICNAYKNPYLKEIKESNVNTIYYWV